MSGFGQGILLFSRVFVPERGNRQDFIECELQMLSQLCQAVNDYEKHLLAKPYPPFGKL
jgi:hypothetical protein